MGLIWSQTINGPPAPPPAYAVRIKIAEAVRRSSKGAKADTATAGYASPPELAAIKRRRTNLTQNLMHYVYRLQSIEHPEQKYTGFTSDITKRLEYHNNGQSSHTSKYKPWKLINYFAFDDQQKAMAFEMYLKSGSGRAFTQKHF